MKSRSEEIYNVTRKNGLTLEILMVPERKADRNTVTAGILHSL